MLPRPRSFCNCLSLLQSVINAFHHGQDWHDRRPVSPCSTEGNDQHRVEAGVKRRCLCEAQKFCIRARVFLVVAQIFSEVAIDTGCATVAEVRKRGDDFWNEFEFYLSDLIVGCVLDVVLVTLLAPVAVIGARSRASNSTGAPRLWAPSAVPSIPPLFRAAPQRFPCDGTASLIPASCWSIITGRMLAWHICADLQHLPNLWLLHGAEGVSRPNTEGCMCLAGHI